MGHSGALLSLAELQELLVTMRADQADLYAIVDKLRKCLTTTEAMVVALASTHPDPAPVFSKLRSWMDLAVNGAVDSELLAIAKAERDRVIDEWNTALVGTMGHAHPRRHKYH